MEANRVDLSFFKEPGGVFVEDFFLDFSGDFVKPDGLARPEAGLFVDRDFLKECGVGFLEDSFKKPFADVLEGFGRGSLWDEDGVLASELVFDLVTLEAVLQGEGVEACEPCVGFVGNEGEQVFGQGAGFFGVEFCK